jgi:hypothetical protein
LGLHLPHLNTRRGVQHEVGALGLEEVQLLLLERGHDLLSACPSPGCCEVRAELLHVCLQGLQLGLQLQHANAVVQPILSEITKTL